MEEEQMLTKEQILDMLDAGQYKELKEELGNMYPVDIAETLEDFEQKPLVMVFRLLAKEEAAETFTYMNSDMREVLIGALTDSELEEVMEEMYLDDTVDVLEEMPANVVDRLLMATDEETRAQINQLLQYPEDSAGSIMNVEYIALRKEMTVEESILKIRQVGLNRETIYTCYVTEKRKLIGRVSKYFLTDRLCRKSCCPYLLKLSGKCLNHKRHHKNHVGSKKLYIFCHAHDGIIDAYYRTQ